MKREGLKKYADSIDKLVKNTCTLLFLTLFFVILLQILYRYILKSPLIWSEEGARILFIWICFLGGTVAHRNKTHVGIDYFLNKLPEKYRYRLGLTLRLIIILFLIFLLIIGFSLARRGLSLGSITLPWLNWGYIYSSVPVSALIMLIYSVDDMVCSIKNRSI